MKRIVPFVLFFAVLGTFAWTLVFLYNKSQASPDIFETETPFVTAIVRKTVATGAIVPRREVAIKSRVSGVLQELSVEAGELVKQGQTIATIQIIPDMLSLNRAESSVEAAQISFENAQRELKRNEKLFNQSVISDAELNGFRLGYRLRKQEFETAESNLQLVKKGTSKKTGKTSNVVGSTVDGMILVVPVKEGASVIESNTFNEGTTIAQVADMSDMIFQGQVDESEVGRIHEGMDLAIIIGAIDDVGFKAKLEYIAPKGVDVQGTIQFEIRAAIVPQEGVFIRAGYSANADIVLAERKDVVAIRESVLQFDGKRPFVEVMIAPQRFEKRYIELGLSDGINVEILSGVSAEDSIKRHERYH